MKRPIRPEEQRLWSMVAATVHPMPGRSVPKPEAEPVAVAAKPGPPAPPGKMIKKGRLGEALPPPKSPAPPAGPAVSPPGGAGSKSIEPRRKHRIAKERDPIGAHIDLHGLGQDQARLVLERFVLRSWDEGLRAILVITGKGVRGDGVLRRMTPEWLADARLRHAVAGISEAHHRHGGAGALYIALKRKTRD
jgi:DNA-nicking Smr family endonuclease